MTRANIAYCQARQDNVIATGRFALVGIKHLCSDFTTGEFLPAYATPLRSCIKIYFITLAPFSGAATA